MEGSPAELAAAGADAVRALNHATIGGLGYRWPSDVDAVLADLEGMAWAIPQVLTQAERWLSGVHAQGLAGHDSGGDVGLTMRLASIGLDAARASASDLAKALDAARGEISHLTGLNTADGGGDR